MLLTDRRDVLYPSEAKTPRHDLISKNSQKLLDFPQKAHLEVVGWLLSVSIRMSNSGILKIKMKITHL